MTDNISKYMEDNLGIKGIFKREIYERFDDIIQALINVGYDKDHILGTFFGIHYAKIVFRKKDDAVTFSNLFEGEEHKYLSVKTEDKNKSVVLHLYPPKIEKIDATEEVKKKSLKGVDIDEQINFFQEIKKEFPNARNVRFGNVYTLFEITVRRDETEKEREKRMEIEDKEYISKYKEISKQIKSLERIAQYME